MPPHGVLQNELAAGCCPADGSARTQPGLVLYLKVLWPAMTVWQSKFPAAGIAVFLIFVLCRKITDIAKIMFVLWTVMILTTG